MSRLKVNLNKREGWLAGVCAGIADALRTDVAIVRTTVVIAGLFVPQITIAGYLVAWLLLDERPRRLASSDRASEALSRAKYRGL